MMIQLILFILLVLLSILVFYVHQNRKKNKTYTVYQVNDRFDTRGKSDPLYQPFDELFPVDDDAMKADLILFSDYALIDENIEALKVNPEAYVYAIHGSDLMANKANLARHFKEKPQYIARTLVLGEDDVSKLKEGTYFLKKNVQRQEGNLITQDVEFIKTRAAQEGYVVCQELLKNPFLVNKRKINMRVYLLISNLNGLQFYYYSDGFMYYTPEFYDENSTDKSKHITTGYIDRQVYKENPLTHEDFYQWLGSEKAGVLQKNMKNMFVAFKDTYLAKLKDLNKNGKRFNIFGIDVAPDANLELKIMEVNKAPDLSYKDERDGNVKLNMVKSMLGLVGIGKSKSSKWLVV